MNVFPGAPSAPPDSPQGPRARRSANSVTSQSVSTSISRIIPSPPRNFPVTAAACPQRILSYPQRVRIFQRLCRSVQRIRHVGVHTGNPGLAGPCAHSAGDSLVVGERFARCGRIECMPPMVKLFIVPEAAAGMRSGMACANARSSTSTMRCDVSTFPPATAAGGRAFTMVPSGAMTWIGRIRPGCGRNVFRQQAAKYVEACRVCDRPHRIHAALNLRITPGEIDRTRAVLRERYLHLDYAQSSPADR